MSKSKLAEKSSFLDEEKKRVMGMSLQYGELLVMLRQLEGRILTICDATITPEKLKATKDLARDAFRSFRWNVEMVVDKHGDGYSVGVPISEMEESEDGMIQWVEERL